MKGLTAVGSEIHHVTVHLHVGVLLSDASCPPWTVGHQAPLSVGFSRQEYWSRVAVSFSRGSSPTQGPNPRLLHCRRILDHCATWGALTVHFLSTRYLPGPRQGAAPTALCLQARSLDGGVLHQGPGGCHFLLALVYSFLLSSSSPVARCIHYT